jgi:hypothetical protein
MSCNSRQPARPLLWSVRVIQVVKKFTISGATSLQIALPTDIIPPHQCDIQEPLSQIFDIARLFSQKNNGTVCRSVPALQRLRMKLVFGAHACKRFAHPVEGSIHLDRVSFNAQLDVAVGLPITNAWQAEHVDTRPGHHRNALHEVMRRAWMAHDREARMRL